MEVQAKVNLTKGAVVNLTKDGSDSTDSLNTVYFGAKWGKIQHKGRSGDKSFIRKVLSLFSMYDDEEGSEESVDLDASLLLYTKDKKELTEARLYFGHKSSCNSSLVHSGDDLVGTSGKEKDTDNETITLHLNGIPSKVEYIVAILNSYQHHRFNQIPYIKLRIYTGKLGKPQEILCDYNIGNNPEFQGKEAIVLGYFYRSGNKWAFKADGTMTNETTIGAMAIGSAESVLP